MSLLNTVVRGNPAGPVVIFVHGWPDTDAVFEKQYAALGATYKLVGVQLPLYTKESQPTASVGYLGYTLDEVRDQLIATIQHATSNQSQPPFLVAHDWGAILSYMAIAKVPTLVKKMVALDIGQHSKPTLKGLCILLAYQWTLMFAFVLPSFIGTPLTKLVATVFRAPAAATVHSGMNYLYCQTWKLLLTGKADALRRWNPPTIPVLYMYGKNKPLFFHSQRWLDYVNNQPGSKVVAFAGDHWFFMRSKSHAAVNHEIEVFLKA